MNGGFDGRFSGPGGPAAPPPNAPSPPMPQQAPFPPGFAAGAYPYPYGARQTHPLAVASLVTGILSYPVGCCCHLFALPLAVVAIVLGSLGLARIRAQPELYGGTGLCIAGIVLAGLGLLTITTFFVLGIGTGLIQKLGR